MMTPTLRKYIEQARKLGACEEIVGDALHGCHTVSEAIEKIGKYNLVWVAAYMKLPARMMAVIEEQLTEEAIAGFFSWVVGGDVPIPTARRRDVLLSQITNPREARHILRNMTAYGVKLPQRWQRKLQRIAEAVTPDGNSV